MGEIGNVKLPPGFQFCPTDEELVLHFLYSRAYLLPSHPNYNIIPDIDLSLLHPWELNGKALSSGNQYYLFTKEKENRVTAKGFWKQVGLAKPVISAANKKVGIKKYLIFNTGEPPVATETGWVMQEYHLCLSPINPSSSSSSSSSSDESQWILCRVYERNSDFDEDIVCYFSDDDSSGTEISWLDEIFLSLDDDLDIQEITDY